MTHIEILLVGILALLLILVFLLLKRMFLFIPPSNLSQAYHENLSLFKRIRKDISLNGNSLHASFENLRIESFENFINKQEILHSTLIHRLKDSFISQHSTIEDIKIDLEALQTYIEEKGQKLRRYEEGYDLTIYKHFLNDLLRLYDETQDKIFEADQKTKLIIEKLPEKCEKSLINIIENFNTGMIDLLLESKDDILILLENNAIYRYKIGPGDSYEQHQEYTKIKDTIPTNLKEEHSTVHKVHRDGFYKLLTSAEDKEIKKILRPVEVFIYKLAEKEN